MELIAQFRQYLKDKKVSVNTVKNYVSDLSTFVDFLKTANQYFSILTLPFVLDENTLNSYKLWLVKKDPISTANRRLSSLRKFIGFAIETNAISPDYTGKVTNIISFAPKKGEQTLEKINQILTTDVSSSNIAKEYNSDVKEYLILTTDTTPFNLPIEQKPYSVKKFWQWKNSKDASTSLLTETNQTNSNYVAVFSVLCICLSIVTLVVVTSIYLLSKINNRPGATGDVAISEDFSKKESLSIGLSNLFKMLKFATSPKLLDPTILQVTKDNNISTVDNIKRTWSIFQSWTYAPRLLDPSQ